MSPSLGPIPGPAPTGGGGPDAYGYRYCDSDTVAPEAPVYNWISIRGVGTQINGLADDNVIGPFPIGFEFPYYWYRVNNVYVGSNGYIAFGDNGLYAHPFPNLPNAARPNNLVAALMADMDYSQSGSPAKAWYWTNPALDTFIVECDSVMFWTSTGDSGVNTFEFVLNKYDSSITVQYQKQLGTPHGQTNGWIPGNVTLGIENITGNVGLSYLYGNIPSRNMPHDTLAIRYYPPDSGLMQVHDMAVWRVMNDNNGGMFVLRSTPVSLWGTIKNTGNQPEVAVPVYCIVRNATNVVVYADTMTIAATAPGQLDTLVFDPDWTPTTNGVYTTRVMVILAGDMFHKNDTVPVETRVVTMPAELQYDAGTYTGSIAWNGTSGGMGIRFVPPVYPCSVTAIKAYLQYQTAAVGCTLWLKAADGPGGTPFTTLERSTINVNVNTPTWFLYTFTTPVEIAAGAFFVCVNSGGNNDPVYFTDSIPPVSNQSWEYTGAWAPYRSLATNDAMMRALVRGPSTGITELTPARIGSALTVGPNPFNATTTIKFGRNLTQPGKLVIYNNAGGVVRTLTASGNSVIWDGKDFSGRRLAGGVFFVRLIGDRTPLKIVLND
jgi:hypothetical protein